MRPSGSSFIALSELTVRASNEAIGGGEAIDDDDEAVGDGVLGRLHAERDKPAEVEFRSVTGGDEPRGPDRGRDFNSNDDDVRGDLGPFRSVFAFSIDMIWKIIP